VNGTKVGTLADTERLIPELIGQSKAVELRDAADRSPSRHARSGRSVPVGAGPDPGGNPAADR